MADYTDGDFVMYVAGKSARREAKRKMAEEAEKTGDTLQSIAWRYIIKGLERDEN